MDDFLPLIGVAGFLLALLGALQMWTGRPTAKFEFIEIPPPDAETVALGCRVLNPSPPKILRGIGVIRGVAEDVAILFSVYRYDSDETLTGEPIRPPLFRPSVSGGEKVQSPTRLLVNQPSLIQIVIKVRPADSAQIICTAPASNITLDRGTYRVEVAAHFRSVKKNRVAARALVIGSNNIQWGKKMKARSMKTVQAKERLTTTRISRDKR